MTQFAEVEDIATRAGRELTEAEEGTVGLLLEAVADEVLDAVNRDSDWSNALDASDKILDTFKFVSIEAVFRVLANPSTLQTLQEAIGSYSYSQTFRDTASSAGLYLTDAEGRRLRRAVFGSNSASAPVGSIFREASA